jgi:hypothetical protein
MGQSQRKRPIGIPGRKWEDNASIRIHFGEIANGGMDWIIPYDVAEQLPISQEGLRSTELVSWLVT